MNDLQGGSNNDYTSRGPENPREPENKSKKNLIDTLLGIGIPGLAYVIAGGITFGIQNVAAVCILDFILLAILGVLCVKFFRSDHIITGVLMLVLSSPLILALLFLGACSFILGAKI